MTFQSLSWDEKEFICDISQGEVREIKVTRCYFQLSTTFHSNLRLLLEESGDDITSEYLCSTTNIAAATRNDV